MKDAQSQWESGVYFVVAILLVAFFFGQRACKASKAEAYKAEIARLELCYEHSPPCMLTAEEYDKLTLELERRQKQAFAEWQRATQSNNGP